MFSSFLLRFALKIHHVSHFLGKIFKHMSHWKKTIFTIISQIPNLRTKITEKTDEVLDQISAKMMKTSQLKA